MRYLLLIFSFLFIVGAINAATLQSYPENLALAAGDFFIHDDISDLTADPTGTTKKVKSSTIKTFVQTTIPGGNITNDTITIASIANEDWGFFTIFGNSATVDANAWTSANLASYLSDETGTLLSVFSDAPIFTTTINISDGNILNVGFINLDIISADAADITIQDPLIIQDTVLAQGVISLDDGVGDSPQLGFVSASNHNFQIYIEDTTDDLQIEVNTAVTETLDIVNIGAGVTNLTLDGAFALSGNLDLNGSNILDVGTINLDTIAGQAGSWNSQDPATFDDTVLFLGDTDHNDSAGDSPKSIFTPATGTAWDFYVEDTGDDLQLEVTTASTETLDIVNTGAGVIDVTIDGDLTAVSIITNLIDGSGAVDIDYGSADITDHTFTSDGTGTVVLDGTGSTINGNAIADASDDLSFFSATTSAQLLALISDETGTGVLVFGTAPTFTTSITSTLVLTDLIDGVGAVDLDYGSADITDHTFISDGGTMIIDGNTINTDVDLTIIPAGGELEVTGVISSRDGAVTLGVAATTFAVTDNYMIITGDGGANTLATITTGAGESMTLNLLFVDALVTITDTDAHTADTVDLNAAFTSADDTILKLERFGGSWYESSRSVN